MRAIGIFPAYFTLNEPFSLQECSRIREIESRRPHEAEDHPPHEPLALRCHEALLLDSLSTEGLVGADWYQPQGVSFVLFSCIHRHQYFRLVQVNSEIALSVRAKMPRTPRRVAAVAYGQALDPASHSASARSLVSTQLTLT